MPTFVLLGRTGNGKSSTGNSILGIRAFTPRSSTAQTVEESPVKATHGNITVIDGSGIGDTGVDLFGGQEKAIFNSKLVMSLSDNNITAFILVIKYGVRFTKQESNAVDMIKSLFGDDVFRRWGIILMTYGDNFEMDTEDEPVSFQQWSREQTGDIQNLLDSCEYRCLIFNNKTSSAGKKQQQIDILLEKVSSLQNGPYLARNFQEASENREKLRLQSKVETILKETKTFIGGVRKELDGCQGSLDDTVNTCPGLLKNVEYHIGQLEKQDMGTGLLLSALNELRMLKIQVSSELTRAKQQRDTNIIIKELNGRDHKHGNAMETVTRNSALTFLLAFVIFASAFYLLYLIFYSQKEDKKLHASLHGA